MTGRPWRALVAGLLLAGCATTPGAGPSAPAWQGQPGAIDLINLWRVSDARGETAKTWLRMGAGELELWRACGIISGSWAANDRLVVADLFSASDTCVDRSDQAIPSVEWLETATSFRRTDRGLELLGDDGARLATLTIDGAPDPIDSVDPSLAQPPVVTDEIRAALREPAALPSALTPATAADLVGQWVPAGARLPNNPHVVITADGEWSGTDGCNRTGSRWALGEKGRLLTTASASTQIGCAGAPVPEWVANAQRAGMDGEQLVLLAHDGTQIARLERFAVTLG